jgi:hypothetical protein
MKSLYDQLAHPDRLPLLRACVARGGIVLLLASTLLGGIREARAEGPSDPGDAGESVVDAAPEAATSDAEVTLDAGADATSGDAEIALDATTDAAPSDAEVPSEASTDGSLDASADVDIYDLYDGYAATFPRGTGNNAYGCSCQLVGMGEDSGYGASLSALAAVVWLARGAARRRKARSSRPTDSTQKRARGVHQY